MYNPDLPPSSGFKFDKTERKMKIYDQPGPGQYKLPCTFADVPRYNIPDQKEEFKWV